MENSEYKFSLNRDSYRSNVSQGTDNFIVEEAQLLDQHNKSERRTYKSIHDSIDYGHDDIAEENEADLYDKLMQASEVEIPVPAC